jgi:Tol biopolymer transport system component
MDPDGGDLRRLTDNSCWDDDPVWSPDGSRIAFASDCDGNFEVYIMDADGSNRVRLTKSPDGLDDNRFADWSPDGARMVFTSERDFGSDIFVMNADGSNRMRLADHPARDDNPRWSP